MPFWLAAPYDSKVMYTTLVVCVEELLGEIVVPLILLSPMAMNTTMWTARWHILV